MARGTDWNGGDITPASNRTNVPVSRADRTRPVVLENLSTGERVIIGQAPDYSPNDADRQWIARNLGDVPARPGSDWRNNTWSRES